MENFKMKKLMLAPLGALLFLHLGSTASADGAGDRFRYSCVSDDGYSVLVEKSKPHQKSYIYRVNGMITTAAGCLASGAKAEPQWDSYRQAKSNVSSDDPNDVVFHYKTQLLLSACMNPIIYEPAPWYIRGIGYGSASGPLFRFPRSDQPLPGSHIEYGDSCYHDVTNDVRVDVANPLNSEIIIRDTYEQ